MAARSLFADLATLVRVLVADHRLDRPDRDGRPLPEAVARFLGDRIPTDPGRIRLHRGLRPFCWLGNSVAFGADIFLTPHAYDDLTGPEPSCARIEHLFHEIAHTVQWREGRLTLWRALMGYVEAGSHHGAWFEQEACDFARRMTEAFGRSA